MTDEKRSEDEAKADEDKPVAETAPDEAAAAAGPDTDDDEGDDDAGAPETEEDRMRPEAIAKRVAAMGEEDAAERLAREEEKKLAARRAAGKKSGKKKGLEVAASKKLAKIGTRAEPRRQVAVASDADPLIDRTQAIGDWAKKNQKTVQIVGGLVAAGLLAVAGFLYWDNKRETDASVMLAKAVADERGRIGEPPKDDEEAPPFPVFKTFDARRDSALAKYREIAAKYPKTGAAILARLSEGSLLLDKREPQPALAAFNDVKSSPLAAADAEVRGRALEGVGMAHELLAQGAEKAQHDEAALAAYKELEAQADVRGFKELAMYHQARVLENKGDKDKAKELLVALKERMNKPEEPAIPGIPNGPAFPYLKEVAIDRLRELDPSAAPKETGMPGGGAQLSPAQIRKMIEDAQKKGAAGGDDHEGH